MLRWIKNYAPWMTAVIGAGIMMTELVRGVGFAGSTHMGYGFLLVIFGITGVLYARMNLKRNPDEPVKPCSPISDSEPKSN